MKSSKFFWFALFVGVQGAVCQIVDNWIVARGILPTGAVGFSWVAFLAWATYFMMGCSVKGGIKAWLCYAVGILVGILIILIGSACSFAGSLAFPIGIVIVVTACMFLEKVPPVDSIAAIFIGCGTFFGFMNYVPGSNYLYSIAIILGYGAFGLLCGWLTIVFRNWYEAKVK